MSIQFYVGSGDILGGGLSKSSAVLEVACLWFFGAIAGHQMKPFSAARRKNWFDSFGQVPVDNFQFPSKESMLGRNSRTYFMNLHLEIEVVV